MIQNAPTVELEGVGKQYRRGAPWAVRDLTLDAHPGEIIGLVGENGAGKSTALRMIATILQPTTGIGTICDFDLRREAREIRRSVGILFGLQSGLYERLTARENIRYFARLNGVGNATFNKRLQEIAELLDMEEYLDRRTALFSTGMRQKTLIARAIIHRPNLLLLDEPTNGLDLRAAENIFQFTRSYAEGGGTVIFSSHQIEAVSAISDRVAVLHRGELIAFRPPHEFSGGLGNYMSALLRAS